jgi:hypothetical protein
MEEQITSEAIAEATKIDEAPTPEEAAPEKPKAKAKAKAPKGKGYVTVSTANGGGVNVRSTPQKPKAGEADNKVCTLSEGARRQVQDATAGWVKVKEGWVMAEFVK